MIGEYLGRLYLTANRKPQAIVRAVHRNAAAREAGKAHPRDLSSVA
jgi:undecaprenyl-phosphate 4-deoxy-4-formamido-L-arabinose transferase